jgi:hypothetical protein
MASSVLYNSVHQAIHSICPPGGDACLQTTASFKVYVKQTAPGSGSVLPKSYSQLETLTVSIDTAQWHGNQKIYSVMVGAIAGAFERGTWHQDNCHAFTTRYPDKSTAVKYHCNTVDYAAVHILGDNYMKVHFQSSKDKGSFDCAKIVGYAAGYIDTLRPEIEEATQDGDLYVDAQCLW